MQSSLGSDMFYVDVCVFQKEWAESRKELEIEREHGRYLTSQRDRAVTEALERVEAVSKELADALKAVSSAETRAQVAEVSVVISQLVNSSRSSILLGNKRICSIHSRELLE